MSSNNQTLNNQTSAEKIAVVAEKPPVAAERPAEEQLLKQEERPILVPRKLFFTKGVGTHRERLRSFEISLRDAGIERCNLVTVSSILSPGCKIISKNEGLKELFPGQITFTVLARCDSNEPHRLIAASIGCAVPQDPNLYGYLSEHHSYGENEQVAGDYAEDLAAQMLAATMGVDYDEAKSLDENREQYQLGDKIVRATNITQSAVIGNDGIWTTVIAAAVFLFN